jgi:WD40 repeat protein
MPDPEALRGFAGILQDASSSLPELLRGELLQRGVVAALEELAAGESPAEAPGLDPTGLLRQAAATHPNQRVRAQAFQALTRLAQEARQPAVDALYHLAVEDDLLAARQILRTQPWQPSRPTLRALFDWFTHLESQSAFPQSQLDSITQAYFEEASPALQRRLLLTAPQLSMENWAGITSALAKARAPGSATRALPFLVEAYPSFTPKERQLMLAWLEALAAQGSQPARETICLLFIYHEDSTARHAALAHGCAPEDPGQRALFFFLAEVWEAYDRLDFDHHLIINAYESAGRALRRRLLEHSRYTGRMGWLRGFGTPGEVRWIGDLTDADWELLVRRFSQGEKFADLWRLSQTAPPVWSAAILDLLERRGWTPGSETDPGEFAHLVALARESLANPLLVHPRKSLPAPVDTLSCLAIHPEGRLLAGGTGDQRIFLWDLPRGDLRIPPLIGPVQMIRSLAFEPAGELLAAAAGDNRIRIFRLVGGQVVKTLEGHRAMIRSLALHPDGRLLYSAGFDGSIRFWRFPYGPELKTIEPRSGEIFSMAISADGQYLISGGAGGALRVWALPEGAAARELSGHPDTVTHLAASPTGNLAASAGRDGAIRVWNFTSGSLVRTIENPPGALTSLALHPNEQALVGGHSDGSITLWSLSTGRAIDRLGGHSRPISGLALPPAGDALYSSDSGGKLLAWDLQTFLTIRLPGETARPGAAAALQERLKQPEMPPAERTWLAFAAALARSRQRYDIELGEIQSISAGEFDIELT